VARAQKPSAWALCYLVDIGRRRGDFAWALSAGREPGGQVAWGELPTDLSHRARLGGSFGEGTHDGSRANPPRGDAAALGAAPSHFGGGEVFLRSPDRRRAVSKQPPRVLHVGKYLPPVPGGIETYLGDLLRVSMRHGMTVGAIVHEKPGYHKPNPDDFGGARIYSVPTHGQLLYAPVAPSFPWRLRQAIRDFKPDILHMHMPNTSVFAALMLPEARRIPWVVHWHADVVVEGLGAVFSLAYRGYRYAETAVLRSAARVIVSSEAYLSASQPLTGFRGKCMIVPLALDRARMRRELTAAEDHQETDGLWPSSGGVKFLAVGRLTRYKGFETLLEALASVNSGRLILVGDGPLRETLLMKIGKLDLSDRVKILSNVDNSNLFSLYKSADVFCMPSTNRNEAFGLVLLESAAFGLPVIASDIDGSGVSSVVRKLKIGKLVEPGCVGQWAGALSGFASQSSGIRSPDPEAMLDCFFAEDRPFDSYRFIQFQS
jgi:glycosyltransferase involved in cell wall biosynthesis